MVYKKDISHFRTIQTRHQQQANEEMNKTKNFKGNFTKKPFPSEIQFELDPYKRPIQKIALLCGSPGAGVSFSFCICFQYCSKIY